jgi:hypothetical protein
MVTNKQDYWLNENELKTPEHDKIVFFINDNYKKIIEELKIKLPKVDCISYSKIRLPCYSCSFNWEESKASCDSYAKEEQDNHKKLVEEDFILFQKERKEIFNINKINEAPVGFGFIDVLIQYRLKLINSNYFSEESKNEAVSFYFDAKPYIKSFGDTIRQIQWYRKQLEQERQPKGVFIIVTYTKGLKERFLEDGVYVYELDEEFMFMN